MATRLEEILGKDINSLKELREEIKRLQDSIAGVEPESDTFKETVTRLTAAQEQLAAVTRRNKDENSAAKDSIVGLEQQYKALYNTYKMLSEEQRNSPMGKDMANQLKQIHNNLNDVKTGVGNFKDNIGNYTGSIMAAFSKMGVSIGGLSSPLGIATKGMLGLNAAMKANPVGAIIAAVVAFINILKSLKNAINSNEQSQMRLKEAMAAFGPVVDAVKNAMSKLGEVIVSVVEGLSKAFTWLKSAGAAVTDFLGITKEAQKRVKEQDKTYKDLAKSQNELTKNRREYQKLNSEDKALVESLREQATAAQDNEEKARLLNEAKEAQQRINERNIAQAEEELRLLEIEASLTANDAAMNDKLAAAQAKVNEQRAQAAQSIRTIERALNSANGSSSGGGTSKRNQELEKAKQLYEELAESQLTSVQKITKTYNEQFRLLTKYHLDTSILTKNYQKALRDEEKATTDNAKKELLERLTAQAEFNRRLRELRIEATTGNTKASLMQQFAGEDWEKFKDYYIGLNDVIQKTKNFINEVQEITNGGVVLDPERIKQGTAMVLDQGREMVEKLNTEIGTNLIFPPDITPENLEKFKEQLDLIAELLKKELDEKTSAAVEESATNYVIARNRRLMKETFDAFYNNDYGKNLFGEAVLERVKNASSEAERAQIILSEALKKGETVFEAELERIDALQLEHRREVIEQTLKMKGLTKEREAELQEELFNILLTQSEKRLALTERETELTQQLWTNAFSSVESYSQSVQTVTNAIQGLIQTELQDGKITEQQAKKKRKSLEALEKVALAANIMGIAGSTASGIMGIWSAYAKEREANALTALGTGTGAAAVLAGLNAKSLASAILNTAAMATQGAAQIAAATMGSISKINSFRSEGSGSIATAVPSIATIDSSIYQVNGTEQNVANEDELNMKVWISSYEMRDALRKVEILDREAAF